MIEKYEKILKFDRVIAKNIKKLIYAKLIGSHQILRIFQKLIEANQVIFKVILTK